MEIAPVALVVRGAVVDPILWILAGVIGWDHRRPALATAGLLGTAGCVWGAVRVAVYVSMGESLGLATAALTVSVCVALLLAAGLTVREIRWYFAKR